MTTQKPIDAKVLARIKKYLAMTTDAGASEAEALFAAELARKMMAENGISNATIEASGGQGEGRTKHAGRGYVNKRWMHSIMRALAEQSFIVADYREGRMRTDWDTGKQTKDSGGWDLWGRESSVITAKLMYDYLVKTVHRSVREYSHASDEVYKEAMGMRIAERLEERHQTAMRAQAREAREKQAQAQHPSAATGNALVVVLEDYAQNELDLNNDMRNEWPPGTTLQRRKAREAEMAKREAELAAEARHRADERERLRSEGYENEEVIELILDGFSPERAEAMVEEDNSPEAQAKKAKEKQRSAKEEQAWRERQNKRWEKYAERQNSPSYRAGKKAGDSVGLDGQVSSAPAAKKLT